MRTELEASSRILAWNLILACDGEAEKTRRNQVVTDYLKRGDIKEGSRAGVRCSVPPNYRNQGLIGKSVSTKGLCYYN